MVLFFPTGAESVLARCVAAEVRAQLGKDRMNQRDFATALGYTSHNYISTRLRELKPFTLDDIDRMCRLWDVDPEQFIQQAVESNLDRVMADLREAQKGAEERKAEPTRIDFVLLRDGQVVFVEAKSNVAAPEDAVAQLRAYDDAAWRITNSQGEEISHHDSQAAAVEAARELVASSAGARSRLSTLGEKRAAKRSYPQPAKRAARKDSTRTKPKMGDE